MSTWDETPSEVNPEAAASFAKYQKARQRYEGRENVIAFRPRQMAEQQLRHDLANAFRSTEAAGKYDPTDDGSAT